MVKNRLQELQEQALKNNNHDEKPEESNPQPKQETEKERKIRELLFEVEELRNLIAKLQAGVAEVKLKHSAILTTAWNTKEMIKELEDLQKDIRKIINETRGGLNYMKQSIKVEMEEQSKKIGEDGSNLNRAHYKPVTLRMRTTQHAALWYKFAEVMTEYNNAQADYWDRCKNQLIRQIEIINQSVSKQELDALLEQKNHYLFTNGIIMETQREEPILTDFEARYAEFMKLEASINELDDMFSEMAMLTESQGEMINRIESNVNNCGESVEEGLDDVKQTADIVSSRRVKIITACVLFVVFFVGYRQARLPMQNWLRRTLPGFF